MVLINRMLYKFINNFKYKITKTIYRNICGSKMKNNMNFWPHISISRDINGKIDYVLFNKRSVDVSSFDFSSRKPLIIIASGPSVLDIDIDFFDSEKFDILGANGAYELSKNVNFKYHVIIDRIFIINRFNLVLNILNNYSLTLLTTMDCLNEILLKDHLVVIKCKIVLIEHIDQPVYEKERDLFNIISDELVVNKNVAFSLNLNKGFYDGRTVAYAALQIAFS
ncbi:hypothetical protein SAMN05421579_15124 [Xenorhabdus japonica]|uniref:Uncharacterized protein n=2 Tax=Xenorhabdus japonica TaxID=53341 RepID=A0A1I5E2A1_9GAMM|nr:hypothetical protein SAMN05421579_15124 [Xenorhabdus japonica]